jgi:mannose-6-phosphate isomerase-like protein (cupin superfamily)
MATSFTTEGLRRSDQAGDRISVIENTLPAAFDGPPLHTHDFDETFYVLDGELTLQLEDELTTAKRGDLVFAPRGVPHTLANLSGADVSYLLVCTPGGFERYFASLAAKQNDVEPPAWALAPVPGDGGRQSPSHSPIRADPASSEKSPSSRIFSAAAARAATDAHASAPPTLTRRAPASAISRIVRPAWARTLTGFEVASQTARISAAFRSPGA